MSHSTKDAWPHYVTRPSACTHQPLPVILTSSLFPLSFSLSLMQHVAAASSLVARGSWRLWRQRCAAASLLQPRTASAHESPQHLMTVGERCRVAISNNVGRRDDEANVFVQRSHDATCSCRYPFNWARAQTR